MAKSKDLLKMKKQIIDILTMNNNLWKNSLGKLMLDRHGKSKTFWYPAFND